jgi:tRNA uridine 5-carboxymethylaminomethyl modification enzyme
VQGKEAWLPRRDQAYLGVLSMTLITKGSDRALPDVHEPGGFPLQLREDNADMRLTEAGSMLGLSTTRVGSVQPQSAMPWSGSRLAECATWVRPEMLPPAEADRLLGKAIEHEHRLTDLLRRPGVRFDHLTEIASLAHIEPVVSRETLREELGRPLADAVIDQVEVSVKYAGYIEKQIDDVARVAHFENLRLPDDLDYGRVAALSYEVRQKLAKHRPETLGQASRISG